MPLSPLIRPWNWETDDLVALTELLHRAYAVLKDQGLNFVATWQTPEITRDRMWGSAPFVMEVEGRIVGTATLSYPVIQDPEDPPYFTRSGVALLSQFGIEPEFRGKGLGSKFIRFALDWCRQAGARELALDTADQAVDLLAMYRHWGFQEVGRHRWPTAN